MFFILSLQQPVTTVILPKFETSGWRLTAGLDLMRKGVRDLQTLTHGLDPGSKAVLEAVLRRTIVLETAKAAPAAATAQDLSDDAEVELPPNPPPLMRQMSVGAGTRFALSNLQGLVSTEDFKRIITFLISTLKHLQSDQSDSTYRRLNKSSDIITELVIPHHDVQDVLKFIGFVAAVGIIFVSGFGDVILRAWMSRTYDGFGVLVFLMGIYYGLELHHSTITRVFFAQGKPQLMLPFTLWNSIITVCATKYLALRFGLLGAASMNCFIDVAQIIPIHYYCSRYGVKELTLSTLLKITVSILGIGTIAGLAVLLAFHNVSLGRGSYALVFAIPIFCVLLGAVYNRLGLIDLPNGIRKMLLKVSFLAKLYGVSGLVPEI